MYTRATRWVWIAVLVALPGLSACNKGSSGTALPQRVLANSLYIDGFVSQVVGSYTVDDGFGTTATTAAALGGALTLAPNSSIRIELPPDAQVPGVLLELQINYLDGGEANFEVTDDSLRIVASGELDNDDEDGHQTFTLLVDLTPFVGTTFLTLANTSGSYDLIVNAFFTLYGIEEMNGNGVFIADIRADSDRIDAANTDAGSMNWSGAVNTPEDFWYGNNIQFDISDVIQGMSRPIVEFNFGRDYDDSIDATLYDDQENRIAHYDADYDYDEEMGQTWTIDLTQYRSSAYFQLDTSYDAFVSPFLKVWDAAGTAATAVALDVSPTGADHVAHGGKFGFFENDEAYPDGGMYDDNLGYGTFHWLADPTRAPYGAEGILEFAVPPAVAGFRDPVLEICLFAPDSEPGFFSEESVPDNPWDYPVEFYILDQNDNEIAHIRFNEWEDDQGGVLKNQIPLGDFKNAQRLKIMVPASESGWGQMAFAPFLRIYDTETSP